MSKSDLTLELGPQRMVPLEGTSIDRLLNIARYNCAQFDQAAFALWLSSQPDAVRLLAARYPPNKIYRIVTYEEAMRLPNDGPLYVIILGYVRPARGVPAQVAVQVLGITSGVGSNEEPLVVPPDMITSIESSV